MVDCTLNLPSASCIKLKYEEMKHYALVSWITQYCSSCITITRGASVPGLHASGSKAPLRLNNLHWLQKR